MADEPIKIPKIEARTDEASSPSAQSESSSIREPSESIDGVDEIKTEDDQNNVWKRANAAVEEKSREKDFEEFLEELLL